MLRRDSQAHSCFGRGKMSHHVPQSEEGFSKGDGKEGGNSTAWSQTKIHLLLQQLGEAQDPRYCPTPNRLLLCLRCYVSMYHLSDQSLASSYFPLTDQYLPHVLQACFSSSSSAQCSFFIHGLGILLTDLFLLLRHRNPHSQLKFTAVTFQGFARQLRKLNRQTLDHPSQVKIFK